MKIELTQSKIARLRERINQGKIKAPVGGRVSKRHRLTGESARVGEPVIDILEDNSIEAILYVPQRIVDEFEIGKDVSINLEPYHQPLRCVVDRFGDSFQMAPTSIKRFYYEGQPLLPVYLTPEQDASQVMAIRIGGTVKRPYEYRKAFGKMVEQVNMAVRQFTSSSDLEATTANINDDHAALNDKSFDLSAAEVVNEPETAVVTKSEAVNNDDDLSMKPPAGTDDPSLSTDESLGFTFVPSTNSNMQESE